VKVTTNGIREIAMKERKADYEILWNKLKFWLESISDVEFIDDEVVEDAFLKAIEIVCSKMEQLEEEYERKKRIF